jgi:uncharacterized membrane protein
MTPDRFFTPEQKIEISSAIKIAEMNTSGEIRVHLEGDLSGDVLDRTAYVFKSIGMQKTKLRNGVLFYLAVNSKKFAVIGDAGINSKVAPDFWDKIKDNMLVNFQAGEFAKGLSEGILMAGEQLKIHFPYLSGDVNELSDDISYG